jgi:hypothetical protein
MIAQPPNKPSSISQCADCGRTQKTTVTPKGQLRTPAGWKLHRKHHYCGDCWRKKYVLRAISIPVASPLGNLSWEDLRAALKVAWGQTTRCANRIMTECYVRDVKRTGSDREKMPPMPRVYLYPELRQEFPALPSQTVASLVQSCQRKYRALRYQVIWTGTASLPTFRYPTPLPIPSQAWSCHIAEDRPILSVRIGERRLELRLRSGKEFQRQYKQFQLLASGEAVPGEAAIYQRTSGGKVVILVKIVAWLPRQSAQEGAGTLRVRTGTDSLLIAVNAKDDQLWRYHGDHLRRWAAGHRKQLQRWGDDSKFEARPDVKFAARRANAARKYRDRMDSVTHEIAAQLAGYAERRRFAIVEYDDTERKFYPDLPWYRLASLIAEKLDTKGIQFVRTTQTAQKIAQSLEKDDMI